MSQENLFTPVDIGQHIDENGVKEEKLSNAEEIFFLDEENRLGINPEVLKSFVDLRESWMETERQEYLDKFAPDPAFYVDEDVPIEIIIKEFSHDNVRINIVFTIGHSRWHHYHMLLKDYLIDRTDIVDQLVGLKQLEEKYSATFNGVGHGSSFNDLLRSLGLNYREYIGQSMQYRTLYYPDQNVEVFLQDGRVKYLIEEKPGWVDEIVSEEDSPEDEMIISYDHFNVKYIPDLGFAAIDSNGNFLFEVFPFDNGPDYPSEGLIRIRENGKVGYADLEGNIVIQPVFDCAFPFQNGVARICEEGTLEKEGEHDFWKEARWGGIDKEGNLIVEPFDLGMFTLDMLELQLSLYLNFPGKIEAKTRWGKPKQISFSVIGEGGGHFVDIYSVATGKQLLVYLFLPWQDLYQQTSSDHDARIPTEQLVTVTQKYIVYLIYLSPQLSEEETDDVMELSDMIRYLLGYDEAQQVINEEDGVTSPGGLQIISLKEYPYYMEVSVATPGTGFVSHDDVRMEFPRKMILLHQVPDMGVIRSDWIKPGPPEDYPVDADPPAAEPTTKTEDLYHPDDLFPDYQPKRTPDTMLDYMPSLIDDLARIPESNLSSLPNLINLYIEYRGDADRSPGAWVDGNMILGGREREYQPSRDELILNEIGDRISSVISESDPESVKALLKEIKKHPKKIEFTRFFYIHYDVMGSGRFFYIDGMDDIELTLPK